MVSLAFSGNAAPRSHINFIDDKVAGLVTEVKKWREAKKVASEKAKKAEKQAFKAKEARKKAKVKLPMVRSKHSQYLQETLLAALDQARQQAVADKQKSEQFEAYILA